jgi:putative inorganic carbon (hco3(-)) transporter
MLNLGLTSLAPFVIYIAGILAFLLSVFWRPIVGIYFLVPLIPLQTARYRMNDLPLGQSVVDIILLGVILGLLVHQQKILQKTPWNVVLSVYAIFTFLSLCMGSFYLHAELPLTPSDPRLADWKNFMIMPVILLLVATTVREKRQMKILILLMCAGILVLNTGFWDTVSGHDFSNFSYDLRDEGAMGYAGVNGLAAFEAQAAIFLMALAALERKKFLWLGYLALAIFSGICLMYSLSRGGYLAFLVGVLFLGIVKQRKLLLLLAAFLCTWTSFVPGAVQQRVFMTYNENSGALDHSAEVRVDLWEEAAAMIRANPVLGVGFDTYGYTKHVHNYGDSHNYFIKVLAETGFVGLLLFLWLLARTFQVGCRLFRRARDPFLGSLGLGLAGWVLCSAVANLFGDRTFLQVDGYMWVIGGLVAGAILLEDHVVAPGIEENGVETGALAVGEVLKPLQQA